MEHDKWHSLARAVFERLAREKFTIVTTNCVIAELASLLTKPLRAPRTDQNRILGEIRTAAWVSRIHVELEIDQLGWQLWSTRNDKEWSFVDCVSFVVMQRLGIREAVTTDRHLEQAGFVRLLV